MNINPRPDQELVIQQALKAGLIANEVEILDIGLESLRQKLPLCESSGLPRTPQEAVDHISRLRKGNTLPNGVTIRGLIDEGRA